MKPTLRMVPLLAIGACLWLAGCVQVDTTSVVSESGSIDRKLSVVVLKEQMGDPEAKLDPLDTVKLTNPTSWKTEQKMEDDKVTLIATRTIPANAPEGVDYALHSKTGPYLECQVAVKQIEGGLLEYTETYTWKGKPLEEDNPLVAKLKELLKAGLAKQNPSEADLKEFAEALKVGVWRRMFGPGEPIFPSIVSEPNRALRAIKITLYDSLIVELTKKYGDKMTEDERSKVAREFVKGFDPDVLNAGPKPSDMENPPAEEDEPMTILQTAVSGPGKLLEANGSYDPVEQQVYWTFYAPAAQIAPLKFRAVFDPTP